jgi:hypothetical protein
VYSILRESEVISTAVPLVEKSGSTRNSTALWGATNVGRPQYRRQQDKHEKAEQRSANTEHSHP